MVCPHPFALTCKQAVNNKNAVSFMTSSVLVMTLPFPFPQGVQGKTK
jgi:hypothetical protein